MPALGHLGHFVVPIASRTMVEVTERNLKPDFGHFGYPWTMVGAAVVVEMIVVEAVLHGISVRHPLMMYLLDSVVSYWD